MSELKEMLLLCWQKLQIVLDVPKKPNMWNMHTPKNGGDKL